MHCPKTKTHKTCTKRLPNDLKHYRSTFNFSDTLPRIFVGKAAKPNLIRSPSVFPSVRPRAQRDPLRPRDLVADHAVAEAAGPRLLRQLPQRARGVAAERGRPAHRLALGHRARLRQQLLRLRDRQNHVGASLPSSVLVSRTLGRGQCHCGYLELIKGIIPIFQFILQYRTSPTSPTSSWPTGRR